jgi:hypothetical protein
MHRKWVYFFLQDIFLIRFCELRDVFDNSVFVGSMSLNYHWGGTGELVGKGRNPICWRGKEAWYTSSIDCKLFILEYEHFVPRDLRQVEDGAHATGIIVNRCIKYKEKTGQEGRERSTDWFLEAKGITRTELNAKGRTAKGCKDGKGGNGKSKGKVSQLARIALARNPGSDFALAKGCSKGKEDNLETEQAPPHYDPRPHGAGKAPHEYCGAGKAQQAQAPHGAGKAHPHLQGRSVVENEHIRISFGYQW